MHLRRVRAALLLLLPGMLAGQSPDSIPVSAAPQRPSATAIQWWHLGAALGGVALVSTLDDDIQRWTVEHRGTTSQDVAKVWEIWGDGRTPLVLSIGTLAGGVVLRKPEVTRLSARLATSVILAAGLARGLKRGIGRARPTAGVGQYDFDSWSDQSAFPSGHTTNAFAISTTLADAIDDRRVEAVLYTLAAGTGVSRVINNRHWLSDVVGGAVLGTTVAKVVDGKWRLFGLTPPQFLSGAQGAGLRWTADIPALRGTPRGQD